MAVRKSVLPVPSRSRWRHRAEPRLPTAEQACRDKAGGWRALASQRSREALQMHFNARFATEIHAMRTLIRAHTADETHAPLFVFFVSAPRRHEGPRGPPDDSLARGVARYRACASPATVALAMGRPVPGGGRCEEKRPRPPTHILTMLRMIALQHVPASRVEPLRRACVPSDLRGPSDLSNTSL